MGTLVKDPSLVVLTTSHNHLTLNNLITLTMKKIITVLISIVLIVLEFIILKALLGTILALVAMIVMRILTLLGFLYLSHKLLNGTAHKPRSARTSMPNNVKSTS